MNDQDVELGQGAVHAWECENCGQWRPGTEAPMAVTVDVPISTEIMLQSGYSKRLRARRVMVVDTLCADLMARGKRP